MLTSSGAHECFTRRRSVASSDGGKRVSSDYSYQFGYQLDCLGVDVLCKLNPWVFCDGSLERSVFIGERDQMPPHVSVGFSTVYSIRVATKRRKPLGIISYSFTVFLSPAMYTAKSSGLI